MSCYDTISKQTEVKVKGAKQLKVRTGKANHLVFVLS